MVGWDQSQIPSTVWFTASTSKSHAGFEAEINLKSLVAQASLNGKTFGQVVTDDSDRYPRTDKTAEGWGFTSKL